MSCVKSQSTVWWDDLDYPLGDNCMEFRLTYEGELLGASKTDTRARHKHDIRRVFHPQLRRWWDITPSLNAMFDPPAESTNINRTEWKKRRETLPERFQCGGYRFVPLVTEDLSLICAIEILFLRPDPPGSLIQSGDIDNRLKTLFDTLRIPGPDAAELGGHTPAEDEKPFYCLLQDDRLISRVSVETDVLLQPTNPKNAHNRNDARLLITVKLKPVNPTIYHTQGFV